MMKKIIFTVMAASMMISCQNQKIEEYTEPEWPSDGEIYITVEQPKCCAAPSRLSYEYSDIFYEWGDGNIATRWEKGDIIKVYETTGATAANPEPSNTNVYADYNAYNTAFHYPLAPVDDIYYRFECVDTHGPAHATFKYIGLTRAHVVAGDDGTYNVDLDIIYNHKIRNWENFNGLAIYGLPLRNYMMRHQSENHNMDHLKYGERMAGTICSHNFLSWHTDYDDPSATDSGLSGLIMKNVSGCVYRIKIANLPKNLYGGAKLTLTMPGITSGHDVSSDPTLAVLNHPMELWLGDTREHQEDYTPWVAKNPKTDDLGNSITAAANDLTNTLTAYIVGWPGTIPAKSTVKIELHDAFYELTYVWEIAVEKAITFEETYYYTFDLTDNAAPNIIPD